MDKIKDIKIYIDTVRKNNEFFKTYYFHSIIDLNLVKLDHILQYGILSKNIIEQKGILSLYTHDSRDYDSKNGNRFVSLSEYTDDCEFSTMFESFPLHTLTSLSLLVNKDINISKIGERDTYFDDEIFCYDSIPRSKIEGIILPEHLCNMPINKVNCLPNDLSCYTSKYINHWIECMETYFDKKIVQEEIKTSLEQLWKILNEYESPEKWTQLAITTQREEYGKDLKDVLANILQTLWEEQLNISNPNYIDVLIHLNNNQLPIYEIKQKSLKRIN